MEREITGKSGENKRRVTRTDPPIDPGKTAVLVIDMQKAFVEEGAALRIEGAAATVPVIAGFTDRCRSAGVKIIWVKREYKADGSDMEIPRRLELDARGIRGVLAPGSKGKNSSEDADGLSPREEDPQIIKPRFSAFFRTDLYEKLRSLAIDTVILTGTTTPNCIRTTAYDALSYDLRVIAAEDCCSSQTPEIQSANMEDMRRAGVEIYESGIIENSLR